MKLSPALRQVRTRAGTIALADDGEGTCVVLWPSLFSDHRLFSRVAELLGKQWRVLRVDGPGFGRSDPPRGEVQADVYADVVLEVLDALGIAEALVGGCSWGGQVAVHAGVRAPDRLRGVLVMNAPLGPSMGGHVFERIGTRWLGSTAFWGRGVARAFFSEEFRSAHPEHIEAFAGIFPSFNRRAAARTVRTVLSRFPGLADVLPRLTVPTTILMGGQDGLYPAERMRPFAGLAPGARVEVVPGCGHLLPVEAPDVVVGALQDLSAISRR